MASFLQTRRSSVAAPSDRSPLVLLVDEGPGMFVVATLVLVVTLAAGALVVRAVSEDDAAFLIRVVGRRGRFTRVLERLSARPARAPA